MLLLVGTYIAARRIKQEEENNNKQFLSIFLCMCMCVCMMHGMVVIHVVRCCRTKPVSESRNYCYYIYCAILGWEGAFGGRKIDWRHFGICWDQVANECQFFLKKQNGGFCFLVFFRGGLLMLTKAPWRSINAYKSSIEVFLSNFKQVLNNQESPSTASPFPSTHHTSGAVVIFFLFLPYFHAHHITSHTHHIFIEIEQRNEQKSSYKKRWRCQWWYYIPNTHITWVLIRQEE